MLAQKVRKLLERGKQGQNLAVWAEREGEGIEPAKNFTTSTISGDID